jgi:hypothetical protein
MTAGQALRQVTALADALRAQGQVAAAAHVHRAVRRLRKGRLGARYRQNLKATPKARELPTLEPRA